MTTPPDLARMLDDKIREALDATWSVDALRGEPDDAYDDELQGLVSQVGQLVAEVKRLRTTATRGHRLASLLQAYGQAKFGDAWWPGNAQAHLDAQTSRELEALLASMDRNDDEEGRGVGLAYLLVVEQGARIHVAGGPFVDAVPETLLREAMMKSPEPEECMPVVVKHGADGSLRTESYSNGYLDALAKGHSFTGQTTCQHCDASFEDIQENPSCCPEAPDPDPE